MVLEIIKAILDFASRALSLITAILLYKNNRADCSYKRPFLIADFRSQPSIGSASFYIQFTSFPGKGKCFEKCTDNVLYRYLGSNQAAGRYGIISFTKEV